MKLASFDIFDTALIRKCGQPECIFALTAQKLYPDDAAKKDDFIVWRRHIGERLQKTAGKNDAALSELYADADFPPWSREELMQTELAVEAENLIANPDIRQKIAECRQNGWTICFISDMYLPSAFLKEILLREKCAEMEDRVFVSCEMQARKDRGSLYDVIRKRFSPVQWRHFGDNWRSDIKMARKHGVCAHFVKTGYTPIERKTMQYASLFRTGFEMRILAGLSRTARLQNKNTPEAVLAADFVAPAYLPYVVHIVEYARKKGIKKLYFLSRDGYILKQAAEAAFPEFEMRELFVSRNSLMLPYLADDFSAAAYLKIVDRNSLISRQVDHMLWQLGCDRKELQEKYQICFPYQHIRTKEQEKDFLTKLFDSSLTPVLQQRAIEQRSLLLRYFEQEKLTDTTPALLVDVGWLGTSRLMINSILKYAGHPAKEFIYFGVRGDVLPSRYGEYTSYFPEGKLSTGSTVLIENYYSQSPNPSVRSYRLEADDVVPVWETEKRTEETLSLQTNRRILQSMMREIVRYPLHKETLYAWAKLALDSIAKLEGGVDLTPLVVVGNFENSSFVRKFSFAESILFLLGKRITAFDAGSACLTFGNIVGKKAIACHYRFSQMFYPVYRKLSR